MGKIIGKVAAIEKIPTTIDDFFFWTEKERILNPFDVVKVNHIQESISYGVIEEISHITDAASYLTSFISSDFGDVSHIANTNRIGMNFVHAKVVGNTKNIYTPVHDGSAVSLAEANEVSEALGLSDIKNPLPCGYLEMYEGKEEDKVVLPVHFNSHFLIGPEGAHLNISGISGLAAKTSYAMFLLKAVQEKYLEKKDIERNESIAFVVLNVKGRDLLSVDKINDELTEHDKKIYNMLGMKPEPFQNVKYFYPYSPDSSSNTYARKNDIDKQIETNIAFKYKYIYEYDRDKLDLLFSNVDDSTGTMDAILSEIMSDQGSFSSVENWDKFLGEIDERCQKQSSNQNKEISVLSWRKFKRIIKKVLKSNGSLFAKAVSKKANETRISDAINNINKNDVLVVDIAKLDEDMQAFVFGDTIRSIYEMKLGQTNRDDDEIPTKIIVFIDELNKYASTDIPKSSPILRNILDITERGRSLGIILFSAEQFKSAIHDRVKGNCASHGRKAQNVLFNDGHVAAELYPNCGINNDNIWKVWPSYTAAPTTTELEVGAGASPPPSSAGAENLQYAPSAGSASPRSKDDACLVNERNDNKE